MYTFPDRKKNHLTKFFMLVAFIIALLLPYYLVKKFTHKTTQDSVTVVLPAIKQATPKTRSTDDAKWHVLTPQYRESLTSICKRYEINPRMLNKILKNTKYKQILSNIKPNQQIQILASQKQVQKIIIPQSLTEEFEIYLDDGTYRDKTRTRHLETHDHYLTATVHGSLYNTAKKLKIPMNLITQMTEILGWEIDFGRDIRQGDKFTIIYKAHYIENEPVGAGDIVAVSLKNKGRVLEAIRYVGKNNSANYYTLEGKNLKKAFSRYPLKFTHISSMFNLNRNHPILKHKRPHKGIDLAAPMGTPIHATGDGRITLIDYNEGYGNIIKVTHNKDYATVYAHMHHFQKGLTRGSYVNKGQIIGYVGQTGLATGPHLHYEFHHHKIPRNPTTTDLPRGKSIPLSELAPFKMNATTLIAHIKLYEEAEKASL